MRNHTVRLYAAAVALLVFFVLWATIAAHPWSAPAKPVADPRVLALATREQRLQREAMQVKKLVAHRWHVYEWRLRARERQIALTLHRHERQLAAARAAAARIAVSQAAAASYSAPATASSAPAAQSALATRVVTLPPQVQVVHLAPVTVTSSSHP